MLYIIFFNFQVDGKSTHIPYRDSKLTRLLQGMLPCNNQKGNCVCGTFLTVL